MYGDTYELNQKIQDLNYQLEMKQHENLKL